MPLQETPHDFITQNFPLPTLKTFCNFTPHTKYDIFAAILSDPTFTYITLLAVTPPHKTARIPTKLSLSFLCLSKVRSPNRRLHKARRYMPTVSAYKISKPIVRAFLAYRVASSLVVEL